MERSHNASSAKFRLWNLAYGPERLALPRSTRRLLQKRYNRAERSERKLKSLGRIPMLGVHVGRKAVLSQRYLRDHGLPYSPTVASVELVPNLPLTRPVLPLMALLAMAMPFA